MKENENLKKELNEKDTQNVSGGYVYTTKGDCDYCNRKNCITILTDSIKHACLRCYSKICKLDKKYNQKL